MNKARMLAIHAIAEVSLYEESCAYNTCDNDEGIAKGCNGVTK
jgi:hypothetical protein